MKPRLNIFLLLTSLLFASCDCNNANVDNGPRNEENGQKYKEKQEGPKFSLALVEGVKPEDLFNNKPIPLVLKDKNFSKHDVKVYKYPKQKAEKGVLHFMDANGKPGKRVESSDTIELKDGALLLMFVPNGKSGKDTIELEVISSKNGDPFKASLELDLKSVFTLKVPEEVKTNKLVTAYLKINADPEEEFTLKLVRSIRYPIELTYDNGADEGVWEEIKNVRIGDKFKGGEHELSMKLYGDNDKVGDEVFEVVDPKVAPDSIPGIKYYSDRGIEIVLEDSKGTEYRSLATFKVKDISFSMEIVDVQWGGFRTQFRCKVNIGSKNIFGNDSSSSDRFKIVSLRANDGSVVSLEDEYRNDMIGKYVNGGYDLKDLYFSLKEMPIEPHGPSTILTLKLEGPEGVVKSADLEITWAYREFMLGLRVDGYRNQALQLVSWTLSASQEDSSYEIEKSGKAAIAFLEEVKFLASQVGDPKLLSKYLDPITLDKIKMALEAIELLKKRLAHFNEFKGTNFVSPI